MAADAGGAGGADEDWAARWLEGNCNREEKTEAAVGGESLLEMLAATPRKPLPPGVDPLIRNRPFLLDSWEKIRW